jgi:hypothetical protein
MKNALINIKTKRIIKVQEDAYEDGYYDTDYREVVQISNAKAATFESSDEPLFLINGNLVTFEGKMEIERLQRREERFTENTDMFKSRKIEEIKKARDAEYNAILVTSDGFKFKSDLETIIDVKTLIEILPDGGSFVGYKSADGSYNVITKEQFKTAITEGIERKTAAFSKEAQLVAAASAATTFAELQAIVW